MRVIAGTARGRRLKHLEGMDTRPTTDQVKEALFNIIQFEIEGRRVLDLFSGTGQLGIESLSRGGAHCTFVELRKDALALVRDNLKTLDFEDRARVVPGDSIAFLSACREKYDMIFLDPPYQSDLLDRAVEAVTKFDILREHGIMVCETAVERVLPAVQAPYQLGRTYRYGKIKLTVFRREGSRRAP
jgi:16S rRNA (guanine(966)-N(2))-methyltransferase RsmD